MTRLQHFGWFLARGFAPQGWGHPYLDWNYRWTEPALYQQAARWEALVETYRNHIMATADVATRVDLYVAMGITYDQNLGDVDRAIEAYSDVLQFEPERIVKPGFPSSRKHWCIAAPTMSRPMTIMGSKLKSSEERRVGVQVLSGVFGSAL